MSNFRNENRKKWNNIWKSIKDYAVPLIWLVIILTIAFNMFSWWTNTSNQTDKDISQNENQQWLQISLGNLSDAEIVYPEWKNVKVDDNNKTLYKWEKIIVKEWNATIDFPAFWSLNLDKLWDLLYDENGTINLNYSSLWVNSNNKMKIKMLFATVYLSENSSVSLKQNEVNSIIYLLNWTAEIENNSWKKTSITKWQKIAISSTDANNIGIDLESMKEPLDADFKSSEWYTKNGWDLYLNTLETGTWETINNTGTTSWTWEEVKINDWDFITIDNPTGDEAFSDTQTIEINWTFLEWVAEITINWINAKLNQETKRFSLKNFNLDKKTNDIIFKVYDENKDILWKYIKTIYYNGWVDEKASNSWFEVQNFSIDASDFKFTSPSSDWIYTTYEDAVSIYGVTPKNTVKKVSVNWYTLKTFDWTNWRYHARKDYENLKDWTNVYEIKYYGDNNKLIYTNNFTIIKKISPVKIIKK